MTYAVLLLALLGTDPGFLGIDPAPPAHRATEILELPEARVPAGEPLVVAERLARDFLADQGCVGDLVLDRDLGDSLTARRMTYRRLIDGVPVRGDVLKVVLFHAGGAVVEGRFARSADFRRGSALSPSTAASRAVALVGDRSAQAGQVELQWFEGRLIWSVRLETATGSRDALIDATTGELVRTVDLRCFANGNGRVFIPNPVQTLDDHSLRDQNNSASAVPASAYFDVVLQGLDSSGYLQGPHVTTAPTNNRVNSANHQYFYDRSQGGFEETMVYYHTDEYQRYLQAIGFQNANNRQQRVNVNGTGQDNSWFDMGNRTITFGRGGVDDAEDADIILHEYGHALHFDCQGGIGNGENSAMSEGYGDYLAADVFADVLVGEWDAVSYSSGPTHYLRRADLQWHYPEDKNGQVHHDGSIWCGMLWDLRLGCGRDVANTLIIEAMSLQSNGTGMVGGGYWLRQAEAQLYGGAWQPYLLWALARRGLFDAPAGFSLLNVSDTTLLPGQRTYPRIYSDPHVAYQLVISLQTGLQPTGPPWNVDLMVGTENLWASAAIDGGIGTIDANGVAVAEFQLPASVQIGVPVYMQVLTFDSMGAVANISNPAAIIGVGR